ncbi:MAG: GntR family transcriptional regulator [Betaproteobacteria bacterium]|nr:GntR family transcriptional regulator [Betaproteobacteria bacterium]NBT09623.1 GntR family transcriptional regulator [Betaproteobacteria bacterium]NBU49007.1 GntR family transcriptional regulator [Betaproteobacteria bacterium]
MPRGTTTTTTQRIVDSITAAIVERRLMPGTKLAEQRLADIFAVSRTVVRQALNQLSRDRLVTLEPARGAFVATPSVEEAHQVFELRQLLEGAMMRLLVLRISKVQIAELRAHLTAEREAIALNNVAERTRLLAHFHTLLARMTGNQVLEELQADLLSRSSLISLMYQSSQSAAESSAEHTAIVDALEKRQLEAAVQLAQSHIEQVERNLRLDPRVPDLAEALKEHI